MLQRQCENMHADFYTKVRRIDAVSHYIDQISVWLQDELSVQDAMRTLLQEANILNSIWLKQMTM